LPVGGFRLEGICGGFPKPDGGCGGLLWKLLGTGGGVKPLGAGVAVLAGGVCDSLDGAELGAGLVVEVAGACCAGSVVDVGGDVTGPPPLATGCWFVTAGVVVVLGAAGAGVLVPAGVEVDDEGGFDAVPPLDPTGGD
jgi:hypothetical protein